MPTVPETQARQSLIAVLESEFASEAFPVLDDKLHSSMGGNAATTVIGVSPVRTVPASGRGGRYVAEMEVLVQFYMPWDKEVDNEQQVSAAPVEAYADRFRRALKAADPNTGAVWYFDLSRVEFPDDPTGNKTRFEAYIVARGNNTMLLETTA